jgi:hypothetical protein
MIEGVVKRSSNGKNRSVAKVAQLTAYQKISTLISAKTNVITLGK